MQNGTCKAYFNFSLAAFETSKQQQQAKHGPYLAVFFLIKEKETITKATNTNKSIIEEHFLEKEMRGAAAPRTPRLSRKDTLHAYRVAANATDY